MKNEFTQEEWDACIKVLQVLSREPEKSLDTQALKERSSTIMLRSCTFLFRQAKNVIILLSA